MRSLTSRPAALRPARTRRPSARGGGPGGGAGPAAPPLPHGPEPRPHLGEVGLAPPAGQLLDRLREHDLLDVQLLGDQAEERLERRVIAPVVNDRLAERLTNPHAGAGAGGPPEPHD